MPTGIYKRTEKHNRKISEAHKGMKKPWAIPPSRKGCKMLESMKMKMSKVHKGKKHTEVAKRKMSKIAKRNGVGKWLKGTKWSVKRRIKFSKSCKGEKGNNWKGGISPKNKKIRSGIEFRLWREAVFARDNWTCQKYGIKGGKLHPHHIKNFAQFPELRFAIDNGITFSKKAHDEFHKIYGKKNNTKEQIKEFVK